MNEVSTLMHHQSTESKFILCKQQTLVHTAMQKNNSKMHGNPRCWQVEMVFIIFLHLAWCILFSAS